MIEKINNRYIETLSTKKTNLKQNKEFKLII